MRNGLMLAWVVLVIWCVGCGPKVLDERDISLASGDIQPIVLGPFKKDLTLNVAVKATGSPVSVYVFDSQLRDAVDEAISFGRPPENTWAGIESTEETMLPAAVPAGKEVMVRLQPTEYKAAEVHLKISN